MKLTPVMLGLVIVFCALPALSQNAQAKRFARAQRFGRAGNMPESSITVGGLTRYYFVHLPAGYDNKSKLPLILAFHGGLGTATGMARMSKLNNISDEKGVIVVYPQGIDNHWQDGRALKDKGKVDDVAFIKILLAKLCQDFPIDEKRVYATGISNGGFFSQRLLCELPDKIAAIASVAASKVQGMPYSPTQARPVMFVLGVNDPLVPWQGGSIRGVPKEEEPVLAANQTIEFWVKNNRTSSQPSLLVDQKLPDGTRFVAKSYKGESPDSEVLFCTVEGGGHCWPGGVQYLPKFIVGKTSSFNGNELIYDFFARHHL